mmetsp:Transcript_57227/g.134326  ORF Transcript_57227/g.134326 Transcript_57227/m.134326 type:complete len:88 (-) Transcript_57227:59-322(-)
MFWRLTLFNAAISSLRLDMFLCAFRQIKIEFIRCSSSRLHLMLHLRLSRSTEELQIAVPICGGFSPFVLERAIRLRVCRARKIYFAT